MLKHLLKVFIAEKLKDYDSLQFGESRFIDETELDWFLTFGNINEGIVLEVSDRCVTMEWRIMRRPSSQESRPACD